MIQTRSRFSKGFYTISFKSLRYASFSWFLSQYNIFSFLIIFGISSCCLTPWGIYFKPCHSGNGIWCLFLGLYSPPINTHPFITPLLPLGTELPPIDGASPSQGYRSKRKNYLRGIGYDVSATSL